MLFNIYMRLLREVIGGLVLRDADDTQAHSLSSNVGEAVETLEHYLEVVRIWKWANKLKLNQDRNRGCLGSEIYNAGIGISTCSV